jgi:hypothetical protein
MRSRTDLGHRQLIAERHRRPFAHLYKSFSVLQVSGPGQQHNILFVRTAVSAGLPGVQGLYPTHRANRHVPVDPARICNPDPFVAAE